MLRFVVDEDMHRSTARILKDSGFEVLDVRDCGLRGAKDVDIFKFAQKENAIVVTGDLGFGNLLRFPIGSHEGIVIAHFPNEVSSSELNHQLITALCGLGEKDIKKNLIIIEPGKIRIRRGLQ